MQSWEGGVLQGSREKHFIISALLNSYLYSPKGKDQDPRGVYFGLELHDELKHHSAASPKDSEMEKSDPYFTLRSEGGRHLRGQACPLLTTGL